MRNVFTLFVLTLCLAACGSDEPAPPAAAETPTDGLLPHQQLAKDIFRELIETDTTFETGNTTIAAEAIAARLLEAGFPEEDVHVLGPSARKGNLVVRLRGRDVGREPLLLLAHLDVVPADPADWTLDPFAFTEQDGYFYGRGTTDDKNEAAVYAANLIRLKQEGFQPDRDIIVALTADEEAAVIEENGVRWLLANHRELIDAEYALNEGGNGAIRDGKYLLNAVQASEKLYQSYRLEVSNPGGHSSVPVRENAIYRLADALLRIREHTFPVSLNDVTKAFFEGTAKVEEKALSEAMLGVLEYPPDPAAVAKLSSIPAYNARLRTTCVATMVDAGHAENALPQSASAIVNCRILPIEDPADVRETLITVMGDSKVSVTPLTPAIPSPPSPLTPEIMDAISSVTEEMWPGIPAVPVMSTGATDGLYLRNAGIPVYGVSGAFVDIDDNRAHGQDERILIKSFFESQEFLYRLTKRLSRSDEN